MPPRASSGPRPKRATKTTTPKTPTRATTRNAAKASPQSQPKTPTTPETASPSTPKPLTEANPTTTPPEISPDDSSQTTPAEISDSKASTSSETATAPIPPPETPDAKASQPEINEGVAVPECPEATAPLEISDSKTVPEPEITANTTPPPETTVNTTPPAENPGAKPTPSGSTETVSAKTAPEVSDKTAAKPTKKVIRVVKKVVKKKTSQRPQSAPPVVPSNEEASEKQEPSTKGEEGQNPPDSIPVEVENPSQAEVCEAGNLVSGVETAEEAPSADSTGDRTDGGAFEKSSSVTETQFEELPENVDLGDAGGAEESTAMGDVEMGEGDDSKETDEKVVGAVGDEEMEVSERQKRRKTEIFIGGLDKDAKEEDIRKIFETIGEVVEVRLMMNSQTGKNKGYAFLRYASATDAKTALTKFAKVEVCGKECGTAPVEGNDTIFLGNINKKWKKEDLLKLLQEIGIEKIDTITVMMDPSNAESNRGFAFLELETNKDAQVAFKKLQKKDVFGKHQNIKVAWAEPLNEPDEEEMLKVKSVFAEGLPSSWDEDKVRKHFKKFGEIESVVLARNMRSKRKDFAFVNYTTREAALTCIESMNKEELIDEGSKVNVKTSLAKPLPKGKQGKGQSKPIGKDYTKEKPKATRSETKVNASFNKGKYVKGVYDGGRGDKKSSATYQHMQVLREPATWRQAQTTFTRGSVNHDYMYPLPGVKRPLSALGDDVYSDPRGHSRMRLDSSYPVAGSSYSSLSQGVGQTSLPYYNHSSGYSSGSLYSGAADPSSVYQMRRGTPPYYGSTYHRY